MVACLIEKEEVEKFVACSRPQGGGKRLLAARGYCCDSLAGIHFAAGIFDNINDARKWLVQP